MNGGNIALFFIIFDYFFFFQFFEGNFSSASFKLIDEREGMPIAFCGIKFLKYFFVG